MKTDPKRGGTPEAPHPPDRQALRPIQIERLAQLTGIDRREIQGHTLADLTERLKWRIDPNLLGFQLVSGRVVRTDPASGIDYPVPFATVHVMDTDCSFMCLAPLKLPWAWLYPLRYRREQIATAQTNACGYFTVRVPRFEIDWVLRWRLEKLCLPELLIPPSLRDLLKWLAEHMIEVQPPVPPPEPDPIRSLARDPDLIARLGAIVGPELAARLHRAAQSALLGLEKGELQQLLDGPAFRQPIAPPLHPALHELHADFRERGPRAIREYIGRPEGEYQIDPHTVIGPFLRPRCWFELKREWLPIFDRPDITFTVTQDVDGDGTEELIYNEDISKVRWEATSIPPVTLHASQIAVATALCGEKPPIECSESGKGAEIRGVSLMQLDPPADTYVSSATGYALRPNRPHINGAIRPFAATDPPATAPFAGTLLLRGCAKLDGAAFYRVLYSRNGEPDLPFLNLSWPTFRPLSSTPVWVHPVDAAGWYPVLPDPKDWLVPFLLLAWPTYLYQPGVYTLKVELADAGKQHLKTSAPVRLTIDNSRPVAAFSTLRWRTVGGEWQALSLECPVIRRPAGSDIEIEVGWHASATHLLYAQLGAGGCGSTTANLLLLSGDASAGHWYTTELDNAASGTAVYLLSYPGAGADDNQGGYSFWINAYSRAIDPSHATGYAEDWNYNQVWIGGTVAGLQVAVVNR